VVILGLGGSLGTQVGQDLAKVGFTVQGCANAHQGIAKHLKVIAGKNEFKPFFKYD